MKTIKIIDLLNKIANGEEVPKKIKVHNTEYHKCLLNTGIDYKIYSDDFYYLSNEICKAGLSLNDEVEIIEEKKIPEKWNDLSFTTMRKKGDSIDNDINRLKGYIKIIMRTQNEIIDYLESKEEEK